MRILDRYILRQYLTTFAVIVLSFSVLFIVIDIFDRVPQLLRYGANYQQIVRYFVLRLPYLFVLTAPVAVLLSGMFLMNTLSNYSESIAIRAAGISIRRMVTPLLVFGFFFSIFILVFGEYVLPRTEAERNQLYNIDIKNRRPDDERLRSNIHYRGADNRLYYIGFFDGYRNVLNTVDISTINPDTGEIVKKITADMAEWQGAVWMFERCSIRTFSHGIPISVDYYDKVALDELHITPTGFLKKAKKPMAMNFFELRDYIMQLRQIGEKCSNEEVDLYYKITFPFANLIILFFSIPLATASTRSSSRGWLFLVGIFVCFAYLTCLRLCQSLGYSEILSPIMASILPHAIFIAVGGYLLVRSEI